MREHSITLKLAERGSIVVAASIPLVRFNLISINPIPLCLTANGTVTLPYESLLQPRYTGAASKAPPLSMVINTMELSDKQAPAAVVLSTSIKAKKGREGTMRNLLENLVNDTLENQKHLVFTCTVNQVRRRALLG